MQRTQRGKAWTCTGQVWHIQLFIRNNQCLGLSDKLTVVLVTDHGRVRGSRCHGRSGPSRLMAPNCTETLQSRDVILDCQERGLISIPHAQGWSQEPKHLLLARNRIRILHDGTFTGYEGLRSLDLQQNHISVVEEGAFLGLWRLKTLLLQHNKLATVSEEALIPMPNLQYLRLYDNPWNCACSLESLIQTLQIPSNRHLANHARQVMACNHFKDVFIPKTDEKLGVRQ